MPKKSNTPKPIRVAVDIFMPRNASTIDHVIEIDPNHLALSENPTVEEIEKVIHTVVLDKLRVKLAAGQGRETLRAIKDARAAKATSET